MTPAALPALRRSAIGRWVLAAAVAILGVYAGNQSLALALRHSPAGLWLAPGDARILSTQSEELVGDGNSPERWRKASSYATQAILRDPLSPSAAATLGFAAALRGDDGAAHRAFAYSQMVSRRDLKTHLWAIEFLVSRADVPATLKHYDLALRTSRQAKDILFPILAGAIVNAEVRSALLPRLLARPQWAGPFINYLAISSPDHRSASVLFATLLARGFTLPEGAQASLLGALVNDRDYATARAYLRQTAYNNGELSRYPRFASNPATPGPFDWNPQNEVGLASSIQGNGDGAIFVFSTVAGAGGPVLRQLLLLPPGRYRMISRLTALTPSQPLPAWTVQCVDGPEVAKLLLVVAKPDAAPSDNGNFAIGGDCPAQWLNLSIPPGEAASGLTGELDFAQVRPVAGQKP